MVRILIEVKVMVRVRLTRRSWWDRGKIIAGAGISHGWGSILNVIIRITIGTKVRDG